MKTSEFAYREVSTPGVTDVLLQYNGLPIIAIGGGLLLTAALFVVAIKYSTRGTRQSADMFFAGGLLTVIIVVLGGTFWLTAKTTPGQNQNDLNMATIAEDYGVEVISVSNPPSRVNRSNDKVSIKDVIVRVDGAVITCQQYIIKKTDTYSVTCGESTPLESLIR